MGKIPARIVSVVTSATGLLLFAAAPAFAAPATPKPKPKPAAGPHPVSALPGGIQGKLDHLLGMGMAFVIVACVAGVFICAGKLALAIRHGEAGEAAGKLGAVGFACILVGSAASIVTYLSA